MRVSRSLSIVLTLVFALACDFEHSCSGENLLTIVTPATVESFEVRDAKGQTLWKLAAVAPAKLSTIRYGEVPPSYAQVFPTAGVRPRDFVVNEDLSTVIMTPRREYLHEGMAMGPRQFCGGYNESSPRKQ